MSNIAVVTLFCRQEVFQATGFDTFAFQWDSVNGGNERHFCRMYLS